MEHVVYLDTPIGVIGICDNGAAVTRIFFGRQAAMDWKEKQTEINGRAAKELTEYFVGERQVFDLPLAPIGTPFQQSVWRALCAIPFGQTRSYKDIAVYLGNPKACRAIGMANHRNPIGIVVPCHRVVGADGSLTGYAGGLAVKQYLLALEKNKKLPPEGELTGCLQ